MSFSLFLSFSSPLSFFLSFYVSLTLSQTSHFSKQQQDESSHSIFLRLTKSFPSYLFKIGSSIFATRMVFVEKNGHCSFLFQLYSRGDCQNILWVRRGQFISSKKALKFKFNTFSKAARGRCYTGN